MKVAILTYPIHSNFGYIMQAYAMQYFLKEKGIEPYTINITPQSIPFRNKVKQTLKDIYNTIKGVPGNIAFRHWPSKEIQELLDHNTWEFFNENIVLTEKINSFKDLYSFASSPYEAFIVGSDQVWRYAYLDQITSFFFDFLPEGKKRMSYAASFGISELDYSQDDKNRCKLLLEKFHTVTVREYDGIKICKKEFNINAIKVLDPVFLLTKDHYKELANKGKKKKKKFLFSYLLDISEKKLEFIQKIANEQELEIVNILPSPYHLLGKKHIKELIYPPVYDFLSCFNDATYVVTDSFHGTAFSIIFNKKFTVFSNNKRGNSRLSSILKTFNLEDRIFSSSHEYLREIDYQKVNQIIKQQRDFSDNIFNRFFEA